MFNNEQFVGKTVLITGGSMGIGLETVRLFSAAGAKVIMVARRKEPLDKAYASLEFPERVFPFQCDVSIEAEVVALFKKIAEISDGIHVIVNNVGAYYENTPWNEITHETWIRAFETNTLSAYFAAREGVRMMQEHGIKGAIVNVGSSAAIMIKKGRMQYSVTKDSVHRMTEAMAMYLAPLGIRVNLVSPGPTATEIVQQRVDDPAQADAEAARLRKIPMGRYGSPRDLANAIMFLASQEAGHITGVILPVDGGYTLGDTQ